MTAALAACGSDSNSATPAATDAPAANRGARCRRHRGPGGYGGRTGNDRGRGRYAEGRWNPARRHARRRQRHHRRPAHRRQGRHRAPGHRLGAADELQPRLRARVHQRPRQRRRRPRPPTTYVVTLKDGIKFSNGNPVTADDVVYSFNRMLDPDLALSTAARCCGRCSSPTGITKIDDQTVEFKLQAGRVELQRDAVRVRLRIVPVGYERFDGDPTTQIGTGPYMLKEFEVGKQSIHVKNAFYWDEGKPYFDEVHIIDFADGDAMINALLADQIDVRRRHPVDRGRDCPGHRRLQGAELRRWWLADDLDGRRPGAVHRRSRPPGDAPHRRPRGDGRAGARRLRPRRQRPVQRRSTPRTSATICRSATRTSRLPRSCSPMPARAT